MSKEKPNQQHPKPELNGAAIIDENGTEVPITEDMIQSVLDQLDSPDSQAKK